MSINFKIHQYINPYAATEGTCFLESVMQRFSFAKRGVVTVTADVKRTTCDVVDYMTRDGLPIPRDDQQQEDVRYWLYIIVISLACA